MKAWTYIRISTPVIMVIAAAFHNVSAGMIQNVSADRTSIDPGVTVTISFRLTQPAKTAVTIIDSDQSPVVSYDLGLAAAGPHQVKWAGLDSAGCPVPPEVYAWKIEAQADQQRDIWLPACLYSRPFENIERCGYDPKSGSIRYCAPVPMRVWVRMGITLGACMRTLVEGAPRMAGDWAEAWDGKDESGIIDLASRLDMRLSVFGYRLPQPCILVNGSAVEPARFDSRKRPELMPWIGVEDAPWNRRRAFALIDRLMPRLNVMQLDSDTFSVDLDVPSALREKQADIRQRIEGSPFRIKWFVDGHCAAEEVDAVLPSMVTMFPGRIPRDGERHFITANLVTALHNVLVGSLWIE